MTTLRGIAQPSDCFLTHMLLAYWRKLLVGNFFPTKSGPMLMTVGHPLS
jgi:hypothetical protein